MSSTPLLATLLVLATVLLASLCFILLPRAAEAHRKYAPGKLLPPGPRPLPIIGNLHKLTSLPHRGLRALSRKYGPVMSLRLGGVTAVVVSSPPAAELFLRTHDAVFASRPRLQVSEHLSYGNKGMAFAEYGPYWRSVRRLCTAHLLSASKTESFAGLRREEAAKMVAAIRGSAAAGEAVDVGRKVVEVIADISCRMILGLSLEGRDHLKEMVHEALILAGAFNVGDYVPYLAPLDLQGYTKRMKKLSKSIDVVLEKIITERDNRAASKRQNDFVDVLLSLMNQPMSPQDDHAHTVDRTNIKAILLDMLVAAFDTSAVAIEWTISELLKNPRAMKRLQEELESVVGLDRMVEERDLGRLEYLDMVVKESFRLHPVAPLLVPREATEDVTIGGFFIPKKSRIIVNAWAIGRDQSVWSENADEFCPERFVGSDIDLLGHSFELLPFGSGRRGCPGLNLGLTNVRFGVAQLVHCFSWELPSGVEAEGIDMSEKFGLSVGRAYPLLATPRYRLNDKAM